MEAASVDGLTDEEVQEKLASLRERELGAVRRFQLRFYRRLALRLRQQSSEDGRRGKGTIPASSILEVLEQAASISLRLPASDATPRCAIQWEMKTAEEFVRTLQHVDQSQLHELKALLEDLADNVKSAEKFAEKPLDVTGALNSEVVRIRAIDKDEELELLTYSERQHLKTELYELDVLGRELFENAEALSSRETELCEWRKLAALCKFALPMGPEQPSTNIEKPPDWRSAADAISEFDSNLVALCDRIRKAAAEVSKVTALPPEKPAADATADS